MSTLTLSLSNVFRRSMGQKRSLQAEREAKEKRNQQNNRLHNLPAEILYHIAQDLPGLALTAMYQTCRKFNATFKDFGHILEVEEFRTTFRYSLLFFSGEDLTQHWLALRRDKYHQKCVRERYKESPSKLLCSSCQQSHPRSKFSDDQIFADPSNRICKAAEAGGLQSCNHLIMPFFALQKLRVSGALTSPQFGALAGQHGPTSVECPSAIGLHFCPESRRREFFHPTLGCDGNPPCSSEAMRYTEPWTYKLVLQYDILRISAQQDARVSILANKLRTLTGQVCPHITMSGAEVLRSLYPGTLRAALMTPSTVRWMNDWHSTYADQYRWTKICACRQPGCDTKFRFALDLFEQGTQKVCLVVQKDVGRLEDPYDPKWLGQRTVPLGYLP